MRKYGSLQCKLCKQCISILEENCIPSLVVETQQKGKGVKVTLNYFPGNGPIGEGARTRVQARRRTVIHESAGDY